MRTVLAATLLLATGLAGCLEEPRALTLYVQNETFAPIDVVFLLDGVEIHRASLSDGYGTVNGSGPLTIRTVRATLTVQETASGRETSGRFFFLQDENFVVARMTGERIILGKQDHKPGFL